MGYLFVFACSFCRYWFSIFFDSWKQTEAEIKLHLFCSLVFLFVINSSEFFSSTHFQRSFFLSTRWSKEANDIAKKFQAKIFPLHWLCIHFFKKQLYLFIINNL